MTYKGKTIHSARLFILLVISLRSNSCSWPASAARRVSVWFSVHVRGDERLETIEQRRPRSHPLVDVKGRVAKRHLGGQLVRRSHRVAVVVAQCVRRPVGELAEFFARLEQCFTESSSSQNSPWRLSTVRLIGHETSTCDTENARGGAVADGRRRQHARRRQSSSAPLVAARGTTL